MKYLKKIYENINNVISTDKLWVVYSNGSFYEVYLDKKDADNICVEKNKESNEYFKTDKIYYSVLTLEDAIEKIVDYTRDESNSYNNPDY